MSPALDGGNKAEQSEIEAQGLQADRPADSGLYCLALLAKLYGQPADLAAMQRTGGKDGKPFDEADILALGKKLNLKARALDAKWEDLGEAIPLPAIVRKRSGGFFILAKMRDDGAEALIQDPDAGRPEHKPRAELEAMWDSRLILVTSSAHLSGNLRKFDVSWFIPAMIKFRHLFGEVIVASLFIQALGLISPLFFMVVIDMELPPAEIRKRSLQPVR